MQEWLDETIARIQAVNPRRVLEIGCGVGLILSRIAPQCEIYIGTDFSEAGIEHARLACQKTEELKHVVLLERLADDFDGFEANQFDTIVINSVAQYFPNRLYLERVIAGALNVLKPNGHIVIGDVRNYDLLGIFHTSLQLYQADMDLTVQDLKQRIWQAQEQEKELLIAPDFFLALIHRYPQISHVQVMPKYGNFENEMNKFRYEAILHVGQTDLCTDVQWHDWREVESLSRLENLLSVKSNQPVGLRNVPNLRLHAERYARQWLDHDAQSSSMVSEYWQGLERQPNDGARVDHLRELAVAKGWQIELSWLNTTGIGNYDVVFTPPGLPGKPALFATRQVETDRSSYTNIPFQGTNATKLIAQWRDQLKQRLPDYMVPGAFVILDRFPLTPNGKIDRKALPEVGTFAVSTREFTPPQTALEQILADIWAELLGLPQVGKYDNFFELGGDSIISLQFISRAQAQGLYLTPRQVFESQTIEALAQIAGKKDEALRESGGYTYSDFPLSILSQPQFSHLIEQDANIADLYPLSPLQSIMLAQILAAPDSGIYFTQNVFQISDSLDVSRFKQAWQRVVDRHTILRTGFIWQDLPEPMQVVYEKVKLPWDELDWGDLTVAERADSLEQLLQIERQKSFEPRQAPLMKCTLIHLEENQYQFIWHCSHLLMDGWTYPVLMQEVLDLYQNPAFESAPVLPYRDYIAWLRRQDLKQAEKFWQERLRGFTIPTPLPKQKTAISSAIGLYGEESLLLTADLSKDLQVFAQQYRLTLNTLFQGAWSLILNHYSGERDIVFGVTVSGRSAPLTDIESRVGLFINTLPLRIKIPPEDSLLNWLQNIMQEQINLEQHVYTPLELLQTCSEVQPGQPLFHSNMRFQNYPLKDVGARAENGLKLVHFWGGDRWHYPLNLVIVPDLRVKLSITYDSRLFDTVAVREILQKLASVLPRFLHQMPGQTLEKLLSD
jgi:SAM-dependent methyltransferase